MSIQRLNKTSAPAVPAAGKIDLFADVNDLGRIKYVDGDSGLTRILTSCEYPKNHLINGGFDVVQRQAVSATTYSQTASRAYHLDRWFVSNENASVTITQVNTTGATALAGLSAPFYLKLIKITNAGKFQVGQILSSRDCAHLRGKRVRLRFVARRAVAGSMIVRACVAQLNAAGVADTIPGWAAGAPSGTFVSAWGASGTDPTLGANVARIAAVTNSQDGGTIVGSELQCALSGNFVRYSACFDVPNDAKNVIVLLWSDGQPAINDEFHLSEVSLTEGPEIPDWVGQDFEGELDACNRFFCKSFASGTAPAQNTAQAGLRGYVSVVGAGASQPMGDIRFPVRMRAIPTMTFYNPAAANAFVRNTTVGSDATATVAAIASDTGADVLFTGNAAWTVGQALHVNWSADAEL